jgi:hypothetical protein
LLLCAEDVLFPTLDFIVVRPVPLFAQPPALHLFSNVIGHITVVRCDRDNVGNDIEICLAADVCDLDDCGAMNVIPHTAHGLCAVSVLLGDRLASKNVRIAAASECSGNCAQQNSADHTVFAKVLVAQWNRIDRGRQPLSERRSDVLDGPQRKDLAPQ